jgi:hypothetical protein
VGKPRFSQDEVNALIPRLERVVGRLQARAAELRVAVAEALALRGEGAAEISVAELLRLRPDVEPAAREMESLLGEIDEMGGEFKGLDLGLVDFPAEIDGRPVLLCWQYGEPEVAFYHDAESGFAGRRPLPHARSRLLQ